MKPRLLFLSQLLPYPPDGGAPIRTFNILKQLSEKYDVSLLCFYRRSVLRDLDGSLSALKAFTVSCQAFPIGEEYSKTRRVADHLRSVATGRVYTEFTYSSPAFRSALQEALRQDKFDLVHVDSLDLSTYLGQITSVPIACTHHNVESQLLRRRADLAASSLVRAYIRHQANLMERCEKYWSEKVSLNVMVSPADAAVLRTLAPKARVVAVPNGVDADYFRPSTAEQRSGIVFVGGLNWFPNRDALDYMTQSIIPALRAQGVNERVTWVGHDAGLDRQYYSTLGVDLVGYVDDVRPYVHRGACFVVPLRVGGGTRLKILDAWAMGMPVVSTSVGCEGLLTADAENILVRDTADSFAGAVVSVLRSADTQARIGAAARRTVEQNYDWPILGAYLRDQYAKLSKIR